ncbi:hypothetical protein FACS1894195_0780 [Bacteroidia bacterium]|nr:hypothetical protein FACS1894195_0780 [Bacteroidia bacterium]
MCKVQIFVFACVFVGSIPGLRAQGVIPGPFGIVYVKETPVGATSGNSWKNACSLSNALLAAKSNTGIKQIWVAAGKYTPQYAPDGSTTDPRDRAFLLVDSVKMYGGFVGIENNINQRPAIETGLLSVLSGDLDNDGTISDKDAYHVLIGARMEETAVIDGFTVTGGNANDATNSSSSVRLTYTTKATFICTNDRIYVPVPMEDTIKFFGCNRTKDSIINYPSGHTVKVEFPTANVTYTYNYTYTVPRNNGGGIYLTNSSPTLTNLLINGNTAKNTGGAIYSLNSNPKLINSSITNNTAKMGSALYSQGISIAVTPKNLVLDATASSTLRATVLPTGVVNDRIVWTSADTSIVKVTHTSADTAVVTAKDTTGTVKIFATVGGLSDSCTVTVTPKTLTVTPKTLKLGIGESDTLVATVLPVGVIHDLVGWASADTNIVKVTHTSADTAVVTAKKQGTVKIYATAGELSDSCTVTVVRKYPVFHFTVTRPNSTYPSANTYDISLTWAEAPDDMTEAALISKMEAALTEWVKFVHNTYPLPFYDLNNTGISPSELLGSFFVVYNTNTLQIDNFDPSKGYLAINRYWPTGIANVATWKTDATTQIRIDAFNQAAEEIRAMMAEIAASPFYSNTVLQSLHYVMEVSILHPTSVVQRNDITWGTSGSGALREAILPVGVGYLYEYYLGYIPPETDYSTAGGPFPY